jgi:hypothetical protein
MVGLILESLVVASFAAWLVIASVSCFSAYKCQCDPPPIATDYNPATVLIIPVRGVPKHLDALWLGICTQIFRPFRVVFAVESVADRAHEALRSLSGGPATEIVVAGATVQRSQKIHNLLAALGTVQPTDAVVVFADADMVPAADWLSRLMREVRDLKNDVVSGYRWMVPSDDRWSSVFLCAANASIATLGKPRSFNLAWGGSMALRRETLDALDLASCWDRAVSDDLSLSRAVRARTAYIESPPDVLVPTPASYSWQEAIAFGRRQYLLVRMHAPRHWVLAAGATTLPLIGWAVALPLAAGGNKVAIATLLVANVLDHVRAHLRRRVPAKLWGTDIPRRMAWLDRWGTPVYLAFHALIIWSTLFGRTINWAGRTYRLDANNRVVKIESDAVPRSGVEA